MTNPSVPDRTWEDLLAGLDDNNTGAIIEEDVRALAGYSRHSRFSQTFTDGTDLETLSGDWKPLAPPYDGVSVLKLQSRFATASASWRETTGTLTSSTNGAMYMTGGAVDQTPTQDRSFMFTWNIAVESDWNHSWGITWWKIPSGKVWPGSGDSWPGEITPILVRLFDSTGPYLKSGDNSWVSTSAGVGVCDLSPGDTICPTLDYYGSRDSTGSTPSGFIRVFNFKVDSLGPVTDNVSAPVGDSAVVDNYGGGDLVRKIGSYDTNITVSGDQMERIGIVSSTPATGLYRGMTIIDTSGTPWVLKVYNGTGWNSINFT